jgi:hypothetical protein
MPKKKESKPSFWSTLPGILTAVGGIIAAFAALITALYSAGVISTKDKPRDNPPVLSSASPESQSFKSQKPEQTPSPEASRDFMVGRWQVDQTYGETSIRTLVNYEDDGTYHGSTTTSVGGKGESVPWTGNWTLDKLSKDTFRLKLLVKNKVAWEGTFKIIDHDRIHNIDQNYDAVRSK